MPRSDGLSGDGGRGLGAYRHKRGAERTPEPFGGGVRRPGLYVVQQHAARRLHYDLRLELGGVLLSWAVPRGPSLDPAEKRLAVRVEDHPVEYGDFEGVIPEGNYGAGAVIVWDLGRWVPVEDPEAGLAAGKLLFDLEGYKMRGRFTLVRTGGRAGAEGREWLLIKKPDGHARPADGEGGAPGDESVLSGLTLEELRTGSKRARRMDRALARSGAPRGTVRAAAVKPMLAERADAPFSKPGWLFEVKIDGYRMIGGREDGEAVLRTRNGRPAERRFPEIARALRALPYDHVVLDGEIAASDEQGRPSFQRLQRRAMLTRDDEVERAAVESPVVFHVFDLLAYGDRDLRPLPLERRKALLEPLLPANGPLRFVPHFAERGEEVYAQIGRLGFEGMVAKRADAPYLAGRSPLWRKVRVLSSDDFVVVGFTLPRGSRPGFGALHLASYEEGALVYAGRVGTGFSDADLVRLRADLDTLLRPDAPCGGATPQTRGNRWVEPRLVVEVRYTEVTDDGLLRHPSFLRRREDKAPEECVRTPRAARRSEPAPPPAPAGAAPERRELPFTNLEKLFWPDEGLTKGDLIGYYRAIAPWLLPYLRDRPLVMTRYPDGIAGKSFFQKDAPEWVPAWVRTEQMWSEQAQREVNYFVCDDVESLLYVINMGTIPLHVWGSRVATLQRPDWCILDLDPKGAPFAHVVQVARAIRSLCEELDLPCYPKTSGSEGLHVLLPLARQLTFEQCRTLAELLARLVVEQLPEIATVTRAVRARRGRVYLDYGQNGHGRLLVAPFSVRPLPGAPVSMPLRWREVTPRLDIRRYGLRNAPARMRRLGEDPLAPVLEQQPDLERALARLAER